MCERMFVIWQLSNNYSLEIIYLVNREGQWKRNNIQIINSNTWHYFIKHSFLFKDVSVQINLYPDVLVFITHSPFILFFFYLQNILIEYIDMIEIPIDVLLCIPTPLMKQDNFRNNSVNRPIDEESSTDNSPRLTFSLPPVMAHLVSLVIYS